MRGPVLGTGPRGFYTHSPRTSLAASPNTAGLTEKKYFPVLVRANLFMHYAFDTWMTREHPRVQFERYCDDVVVHCETQQQAVRVRDAIAGRLAECGGLQLHPDKTRIVY